MRGVRPVSNPIRPAHPLYFRRVLVCVMVDLLDSVVVVVETSDLNAAAFQPGSRFLNQDPETVILSGF